MELWGSECGSQLETIWYCYRFFNLELSSDLSTTHEHTEIGVPRPNLVLIVRVSAVDPTSSPTLLHHTHILLADENVCVRIVTRWSLVGTCVTTISAPSAFAVLTAGEDWPFVCYIISTFAWFVKDIQFSFYFLVSVLLSAIGHDWHELLRVRRKTRSDGFAFSWRPLFCQQLLHGSSFCLCQNISQTQKKLEWIWSEFRARICSWHWTNWSNFSIKFFLSFFINSPRFELFWSHEMFKHSSLHLSNESSGAYSP